MEYSEAFGLSARINFKLDEQTRLLREIRNILNTDTESKRVNISLEDIIDALGNEEAHRCIIDTINSTNGFNIRRKL